MEDEVTVKVNIAREMIKAKFLDLANNNSKEIIIFDFVEQLMYDYNKLKIEAYFPSKRALLINFMEFAINQEDRPEISTAKKIVNEYIEQNK